MNVSKFTVLIQIFFLKNQLYFAVIQLGNILDYGEKEGLYFVSQYEQTILPTENNMITSD